MNNKDILKFIFELGQLRRVKHEGIKMAGVENPESVADHSLRAAQISFILAKLENYQNPHEVCVINVFHDIEECRIGDFHAVARRYIKANREKAVEEQTEKLNDIGKDIQNLWHQMEKKNTTAGIIAKDADELEQAVTAKEYIEKGYHYAQNWIDNVSRILKTKSARQLLETLKKTNSNEWWQGLKKLTKLY